MKTKNLKLKINVLWKWLTVTRRRKILSSFLAVLVLISGIRFAFFKPKEAKADWYDDSWHYRKKIVIDDAQVSGSSDLSNFPLLINLTTDNQLRDKAQQDGDDILFTDINGVKLDHEIETYTPSAGSLVAWVKIPTLYTNGETVIYLYYGNPNSPNQQNPHNVWDERYELVLHMSESSGNVSDSTINSLTATNTGTTQGTGKVGNSRNFNGTNQYLQVLDDPNLDFGSSENFTLQMWVKTSQAGAVSSWPTLMQKEHDSPSRQGYEMYLHDQNVNLQWYGATYVSGSSNPLRAASNVADGTWHRLVFVRNGTTYTTYTDTTTTSSTLSNGDISNTGNLRFGTDRAGNYDYNGDQDEVRISRVARSADWLTTEYNNQNSPATFYSLNTEEKGPLPNLYLMFDEGYGTATQDQTEYNNDGTLSGAAWKNRDLCLTENCVFFDGVDDVVTVSNSNSIDMDQQLAGALTYQTWIRATTGGEAGTGAIFNKGANTRMRIENQGVDGFADLTASLDLATTDATVSVVNGIDSDWHLVAMTYTDDADDEITVYIDGVARGTSTNGVGSPAADANNLLIGGSTTTNYGGFIDNFKIYDRERSAEEIKTDYLRLSGAHGAAASFGERDYSFLSNGLAGYWKMDENTGTTLTDLSGRGNSLTTSNTTWTSAKFHTGLDFNGTTGYAQSTATNILPILGDLTVSFWMNFDSAATDETMTNYRGSSEVEADNSLYQVEFNTTSGNDIQYEHEYNAGVNQTIVFDTNLSTGTWYQITLVRRDADNTITLYVNGQQIGDPQSYTNDPTGGTSARLFFGAAAGPSTLYDGRLDDIRVYNRSFTSAEASGLYNWAPGPVAYWKLDENTGSKAYDTSSNDNDGDLTNGPTWTSGKFGNALSFDGASTADDVVNIASASAINNLKLMTGEAWVFPKSLGEGGLGRIFSKFGNTQDGRSLSLYTNNSITYYHGWSGSTNFYAQWATPSNSIVLNQWNHVAVAYDQGSTANDPTIYINGIEQSLTEVQAPSGTVGNDSASPMHIGNRINTGVYDRTFDGFIDDVKYYNYIRTQGQIIEDMNGGHPSPGSPVGSPILNLKFDEGYGDTAYDASPQGNDGNLGYTNSCPSAVDSACPTWTNNGVRGKALDFDIAGATDDIVTATSSAATLNLTGAMTVSAWVNLDTNTTPQTIVSRNYDTSTRGYSLRVNGSIDQKTEFHIAPATCNSETFVLSSEIVPTGRWIHWVGVYEPSVALHIYKNGVLDNTNTTSIPSSQCANNQPVGIGRRPPGAISAFALDGKLDDVQIYNFALTPEQVKVLYNQSSSAVWGATSTTSVGTGDWSASREYCPPGDTGTCSPPVLEQRFNEGTGTSNTQDTSTNNLTGTMNGGIPESAWVLGKVGNALDFDGINDFVTMGNPTQLQLTGAMSASAWIWIDSWGSGTSNNSRIVTKGGTAGARGWEINIESSSSSIDFAISPECSTQIQASTTNFSTGRWHFIEGVYSPSTYLRIYVDGLLQGENTTSIPASICNPGNQVYIGARTACADCYFHGKIDEVRIFNYARTEAQVAWDYNKGRPVGWWKMDDCQGTSAADLSGNGYNGAITPGTLGNTSAGSCSSGISTEMWNNGTTGKLNSSLDFDGSDDFVNLGNNFHYSLPISFSAWVKLNSNSIVQNIIATDKTGHTVHTGAWLDVTTTGKADVGYADNTACGNSGLRRKTGATTISTGVWYHIAGIMRGATDMDIYVNGINDGGSYTGTGGTIAYTSASAAIGKIDNCLSGDFFFDGQIDDVKIFNYPLTAEQVKTIYNEGSIHFE